LPREELTLAIMVIMEWEGVTRQQYDDVRRAVGWLERAPDGGRCHTAAFGDRGLRITDVWDSAEQFQAFADTRLMPEVQKMDVPGEPNIEILPLHEMYCPGPDTILAS
jgi:hypothetical protein